MARTPLDTYKPRPKIIRHFLAYIMLFIAPLATRITVRGRENLPEKGPFIIAINHFSRLDPAFIIYGIRRPINFMMASDQAVEWFLWWAPWLYGYIPTNRTRFAPSTIKMAKSALSKGEILGIFPEGTSTANEIRPAKKGVVYLSAMTDSEIVPVSILGLENAWSQLFRGIRPRVRITIGKPFGPLHLPPDKDQKEKAFTEIGNRIMTEIADLLPQENRGYLSQEGS